MGTQLKKNEILLYNDHAVPHNPYLLLKYETHVNMEWYNQSTSIKCLFKYINKVSDRISIVIVPSETPTRGDKNNIDEIKQYLYCRYISLSATC